MENINTLKVGTVKIYNGTQHLNSFNSLLYLYGCSLQNREYKNINNNLHYMCMCVEESKHS